MKKLNYQIEREVSNQITWNLRDTQNNIIYRNIFNKVIDIRSQITDSVWAKIRGPMRNNIIFFMK